MSALHNPVLVKELRSRMRGARAFVVLTVFLAITTGFMLLLYLVVRDTFDFDPLSAGARIGNALFLGVVFVSLVQVMIIVPAQAAGALASERERETYDLLVATLLPPWKIVLGKLFAALAYAVLLIVAVVPLMAIAFFFGGVTGAEVAIALVGLLATALLYGSVGILWSTISRRVITATVLAQATNVFVLLGLPFLLYVFAALVIFRPPEPAAWVQTYPSIYGLGALLAVHPFVALGSAEIALANGETRWFFPLPDFGFFRGGVNGPPSIWIPAPWLAFVIAAVVGSVVLSLLATRNIRRITGRRPRQIPAPGSYTEE